VRRRAASEQQRQASLSRKNDIGEACRGVSKASRTCGAHANGRPAGIYRELFTEQLISVHEPFEFARIRGDEIET
jgi:hypothetical protein